MSDDVTMSQRTIQAIMDNLVKQRERAFNEAAEHAARADVAEQEVEALQAEIAKLRSGQGSED